MNTVFNLMDNLERDSNIATELLKINNIVVNADKRSALTYVKFF